MMRINSKPKYISYYIDRNFEFILAQIYQCYQRMLRDYDFIENNENKIRNILYKDYLINQAIIDELKLNNFAFEIETGIVDDSYKEIGYTDIKVINLQERMHSVNANYIIECKRLDNSSTLNKKYINEGVNRFVDEKYPTNYDVNGMLGFIVENFDINKSITEYFKNFIQYSFIQDFPYSYRSSHTIKNRKNITLYHLMLDFSSKIKQSP